MKGKSFIIFQFIQIVIIAISFSVFMNGCHCVSCSEKEESQIPSDVLKEADQFIVSKTGDEFFKKYIIADFSQSKHIAPDYLMVYKLYMPEKPFVDELIRFTVDSMEKVLTQYEVVGIPDCNANPMDCNFVVDEKIARQIATEQGLPKGIKDWKADFILEGKHNKYVWQLLSTTRESKGEAGYRGEGEKIIIDANDASVIVKDTWKIN